MLILSKHELKNRFTALTLCELWKLRSPRPFYAPAQPALHPAPLAQELALDLDEADVFVKPII
jgi:hypothetical protein